MYKKILIIFFPLTLLALGCAHYHPVYSGSSKSMLRAEISSPEVGENDQVLIICRTCREKKHMSSSRKHSHKVCKEEKLALGRILKINSDGTSEIETFKSFSPCKDLIVKKVSEK